MAGRPAKTAKVIKMTNEVSHRTKREIAMREAAENQTLSGYGLTASEEVLQSPEALAVFDHVRELLASIDKADELYGAQINRYCLLTVEERALSARKAKLEEAADGCDDPKDAIALYRLANECDREQMAKRKMMMDIEKENLMSIASALRSIPKAPETKTNALREALLGTG